MNKIVSQLKNNAIFQMSLSSKELFHSNFLAWLAEDENTHVVFNAVLRGCFGVTDWSFDPKTMKVGREYKNFDFCICDRTSGAVRLILENKFKSIPYSAQLKKYEDKVTELNKKQSVQATHILLSLADDYLDKKEIEEKGIWKILDYQTYIDELRRASKDLDDSFRREVIRHYCDFVTLISNHANESLKKIQGSDTWDVLNNEDFEALRLEDLWQKLVMHKHAQKLIKLLQERLPDKDIVLQHSPDEWKVTENNPIRVGVQYFRSEALVEVETLLPTSAKFLIQQQGNHPLSIGFLIQKDEELRAKRSERNEDWWNRKVNEKVMELHLSPIMAINEGKRYCSFQAKNDVGYYYKKGTHVLSIDETLKEMVTLLEHAIKLSQTDK